MSSAAKRRLCFVITRLVAGGAQMILIDLVRHFKDEFEVHLISGEETGREGSLWDIAHDLLPPERIHKVPHLVRNTRIHSDLLALKELCKVIKELKPDIVHTHTSKAGMLGRSAAKWCQVPLIIHSTHGLIYHSEAKIPNVSGKKLMLKFFKALERLAGKWSHGIVCLSESEVGDVLRMRLGLSRAVTCIPNGINLQELSKVERSPDALKKPEIRLGNAGRLNREKGHDLLLRSFAHLVERFPQCRLELAGDGPMLNTLQNMAKELEIADKVTFHGFRSDMKNFLEGLDIFVLSSHYEGFGLVLVEAMATGLPVVATDVGGVSEVLKEGQAGIIVPPGSEPELVIGIEYLLHHPKAAHELGQQGKKRALENYSLNHMIEAHRELYDRKLIL